MSFKDGLVEADKEKNYLFISPRCIEGGAVLVNSYETLKLYENIDSNTLKFAHQEIFDLMQSAKSENGKAKKYFEFTLIFCGDFDDIESAPTDFSEFVNSTKKRIIAIYNYVEDVGKKEIFIDFSQTEAVYKCGFVYLDLKKLLEEFRKNDIKCEICTIQNSYRHISYVNERLTQFVISCDLNI